MEFEGEETGNVDDSIAAGFKNGVDEHGDGSVESKAVKSGARTKGYGLKKWRRIPRESRKDSSNSNKDSSELITKRGLSISGNSSTKAMHFSAGQSEGTNEFVRSPGNSVAVHGPGFMAGEDQSGSESSTAASASCNRNLVNLSRNSSGRSVQKGQQRKGRIESSKKARGESVKIEMENSHSSLESDSRSSNFVFMQGASSVKVNGTKGGVPLNFDDGEIRGEDQECEGRVSDDTRARSDDGNSRQFGGVFLDGLAAESSSEAKGEKSEDQGTSTDRDPVIESIFTLQAAQEALEREVKNFKEIAKEAEELQSSDGLPGSPDSSETEVISQKQAVSLDETKLESIISSGPRMEERGIATQFSIDMEAELENLFKQKIETEVQLLVSKAAAADQIALLEEQKSLASEQARIANKLEDAEQKAAILKEDAEKLENYCKNMVSTADDTLKLQKSVCKHTFCFFSQLILLMVVVAFFIFQFSPNHHTEFVPT